MKKGDESARIRRPNRSICIRLLRQDDRRPDRIDDRAGVEGAEIIARDRPLAHHDLGGRLVPVDGRQLFSAGYGTAAGLRYVDSLRESARSRRIEVVREALTAKMVHERFEVEKNGYLAAEGADLSDVDFRGVDWLEDASLSEANLFGANLSGVSLRDASLSHADLSHAELCGADFTGADLSWADLSGADIAVASLLSPLVLPEQHPTYRGLAHPPRLAATVRSWDERPSLKWVRDIYAKHR